MPEASFRCYAQLNDFLPPARRQRRFAQAFAPNGSAKHAIEALGVPHTEVGLLLVNGEPADLSRRLATGDRVTVYPPFASLDLDGMPGADPPAEERPRFVADAHLGALARRLRMAGFDTVFDTALHDADIVRLAADEGRIALSRDRDLLMRRALVRGGYVHALEPAAQLREVVARFSLGRWLAPFTRCLRCNAPLDAVDAAAVEALLPPRVRERQRRFRRCPACARVYWEGSHWRRMRAGLDALLVGHPTTEDNMDEDAFNISIRKFLKMVGVSSQREIEHAVARARDGGAITGSESFPATMTLEIAGLKLNVKFDGEIRLQ
jgi:uncharacterized protein with PIN domain